MYDELIKNLRYDSASALQNCEFDFVHDWMLKAADAIEELSKKYIEERNAAVDLTGWLAEEHAKKCPHYIRNVHDRGDDSLCDKWVCEIKSLPKWIPVTERLPDEHEFVLVCNDDGEMMIAKMVGCYYKYWVYKYCAYDTDCWDENENGLITHWMPLPELPKGGEKV